MATASHLPSYLPFTCLRFCLSQNHNNSHYRLSWNPRQHLHQGYFTFTRIKICACSGTKSSRTSSSRKVKSNEELRDEIREFLCSVGLPKSHVPSMKELSEHGRNDLANIVRRRGYKLIRELLTSYTKTETGHGGDWVDGMVKKTWIGSKFFSPCHPAIRGGTTMSFYNQDKSLAGQDEKVNKDVEEVSSLVEVQSIGNYFGSTDSSSNIISDGSSTIQIEFSTNSLLKGKESYTLNSQNENVDSIIEDTSLSTDVSDTENLSSGLSTDENLNLDDSIFWPIESSSTSPLEETDSFNIKGQREKENNIAEKVSSSSDALIMENYSDSSNSNIAFNFSEHDYTPQTTSAPTTLEEKVAKFIQNGDLDMIEDNVNGITEEIAAEESNGVIEGEDAKEVKSTIPGAEYLEYANDNGAYGSMISNEIVLTSKQIDPTATVTYPLRGDHSAADGPIIAHFDEDSDVETNKRENQLEINHLKFMLHQKELELSRLKKQIEKEKHALSVLQTKAETEINKAQKLISEKGAELHAAEESLSGLEEVQLQYSGDGDIVEVAGSFNGWHHRIKMDPQPSSSIIEPIGSRKCRLWSTVLWLYPGTYEIKFIVDGQWRIDPQRESVSRGGISNNILRVKR